MRKSKSLKINSDLSTLMNVGAATYQDLLLLEIKSINDLACACPDELYTRLQKITGRPHDPCVWDVFAAIINEARTGKKEPWWRWTKIRKQRQSTGTFCT